MSPFSLTGSTGIVLVRNNSSERVWVFRGRTTKKPAHYAHDGGLRFEVAFAASVLHVLNDQLIDTKRTCLCHEVKHLPLQHAWKRVLS
mmetsp:Transcript_36287/g.73797  ORF Transcript_36287/g.73797 Transcript_36287/m.73797 type:complete len:88 (-) Transcript_36287:576-839(-)